MSSIHLTWKRKATVRHQHYEESYNIILQNMSPKIKMIDGPVNTDGFFLVKMWI